MKPQCLSVGLVALMGAVAFGATTQISDPEKFVSGIYGRLAASEHASAPYLAPEDIYTTRLKALIAADRRRAKGEVGCLDFDFWVNGQDLGLSNIHVSSRDVANRPGRKLVIATFVNLGELNEIHFDFLRVGGKWLLDDAHSVKNPRWTLSELLKCQP